MNITNYRIIEEVSYYFEEDKYEFKKGKFADFIIMVLTKLGFIKLAKVKVKEPKIITINNDDILKAIEEKVSYIYYKYHDEPIIIYLGRKYMMEIMGSCDSRVTHMFSTNMFGSEGCKIMGIQVEFINDMDGFLIV